jgi:beta-glucanase (GH16 family)
MLVAVTALLVATGCETTGSSEAATRTTASLSLSQNRPIVHEHFSASGAVSTRFRRAVTLRVRHGAAWRVLQRGTTGPAGGYRFTGVSASVPRTYSVHVPAVRHAGRVYRAVTTGTKQARPVHQKAALSVLPAIAQRGATPASSNAARNVVVARFTPARPGRGVVFYRQLTDGSWATAGTAHQGADGRAYFSAAASSGSWGPFKARTVARAGAATRYSAVTSDTWAPAFGDQFSGTSLDLAKWSYRNGAASSRQHSRNDQRAVDVGAGTLNLHVRKDPSAPATKYLNAQVSTDGKFDFTYGVASARIRFPRGRGQHGSFWLQSPTYGDYPGDPGRSGSEIDAVEFFGKDYPGGGLANFLYYKDAKGDDVKLGDVRPAASSLIPSSDTWWNSYHVFTVRWTPQGYTFYVDGRVLGSSTRAVSKRSEYLILSLLTSDWELPHLDRSTLPTTMRVDWAKVWQPAP